MNPLSSKFAGDELPPIRQVPAHSGRTHATALHSFGRTTLKKVTEGVVSGVVNDSRDVVNDARGVANDSRGVANDSRGVANDARRHVEETPACHSRHASCRS